MKKMIFALALGLALFEAPQVQAQPALDFGMTAPVSGTIAYAGGAAALTGTNISVAQVTGINGTVNNGVVLPINTGLLTFSSGVNNGTWTWGAGGTFGITGSIASTPGPTPPAFPGTAGPLVFSGSIVSASILTISGVTKVVLAAVLNHVDPTVATYFGLGPGGAGVQWDGALNLSFTTTAATGASFSTTTLGSGDFQTSPTPEPSTMALAGLGALGLIGYGLRRRKAMGA
jgi:hypothetical protein